MNSEKWIREIMSLKVPNVSHKDVTKFLVLFYIIEYKKINERTTITELAKYIYEFYIDNPEISKYNTNSIIRNISKYNVEDITQIVRNSLYDWKSDFSDGCLEFDDNNIYVSVEDLEAKTYETSLMVAKMLYKKATNSDFDYSASLEEIPILESYDLDLLNNTRLKNRVLEDIDYCCCCDASDDLFIINLSDDIKEIKNPYNYVTVCKEHYNLYMDKYFYFDDNGVICINKNHPLLNRNMHISLKVMRSRKKK